MLYFNSTNGFNYLNTSVLCMKIIQDNLFQLKNIENY